MSEHTINDTHSIRRPEFVTHELLPIGYSPETDDCVGCSSQLVWRSEFIAGDFRNHFDQQTTGSGPRLDAKGYALALSGVVFWEGICPNCNRHAPDDGSS